MIGIDKVLTKVDLLRFVKVYAFEMLKFGGRRNPALFVCLLFGIRMNQLEYWGNAPKVGR